MLKRYVTLLAILATSFLTQGCAHQRYHALERSLTLAHDSDTPLALKLGSDFLDTPGTIIFRSRREGLQHLIELARAGEPELFMIYLPMRKAWLTASTVREIDTVRLNSRYVVAALLSEPRVEIWHTHNNIGHETDLGKKRKLERAWTMPSTGDLLQMYDYMHEIPSKTFRGCIAHIHGTTCYWNDTLNWAQPIYVRWALLLEGDRLIDDAMNQDIADLKKFAKKHEGVFRIKVTLMP